MTKSKAAIIGAGAMGMATGVVLSANEFAVVFWDKDKEVVDGINRKHLNPRSLPHIKLDKSVRAEERITEAVFGADIVVIALPSHVVRPVAFDFKDAVARNCIVISVSKGLEVGSLATMTSVLTEVLPGWLVNQIMSFSGPTLAGELAAKKPAAALLASKKSDAYSRRAREALSTDWLHVTETRDVLGVQLAAVAKNALAVMFGIVDGLGYGGNGRGWLLTEGFRDMARLIWKMGGQEDTVYGLAGFGDMIATALSLESRNRMFGELVGRGRSVAKALEIVKQTVEGIDAVESLHELSEKERLQLPTLRALYEVVGLKRNAAKVFTGLIKSF